MSSLLICDRYMPHNGGSRRYYHQLALRLGPDTRVLTGFQPGDRDFDRTSGVRTVRRLGIRPNYAVKADRIANPVLNLLLAYGPGMAAVLWWSLLELLWHRPRVVHAAGYAFAGLAARVWCPLVGIPYLVYAHGEDVMSTSRRRFFARFMRWVFAGADGVIVNSLNTARLVREVGIEAGQIRVAYPGVDDKWFLEDGVAEVQSHAQGPVLLTVGRLVPHKGHATVLEALPRLLKSWPDLVWILVGKGPEETALRARAMELGVAGSIRFESGLSDDQLRGLYRGADVFVQPNGEVDGAFEGYGMVFLEAGAAGLPVVGGDHGGVREVIRHGETGLLVTSFDVAALAAALELLLKDEGLRRQLGRRGRAWARSRGWDATLDEAVKCDRLLAGRGAVAGKLAAS